MNMSVHSGVGNRESVETIVKWRVRSHLKLSPCHLSNKTCLLGGIWPKSRLMCYSYSIPSPFIKLLLIITVAKTLEFTTLVRYYFLFSSKIIFCLMLLIYYGIAPLVFILTFSSLFLFLTFFFLSFLLSCCILHSRSWNQCSQVMVVQNAR